MTNEQGLIDRAVASVKLENEHLVSEIAKLRKLNDELQKSRKMWMDESHTVRRREVELRKTIYRLTRALLVEIGSNPVRKLAEDALEDVPSDIRRDASESVYCSICGQWHEKEGK